MSGPTRKPGAAGPGGAGAAAASSRQTPGTARRPPARPLRRSSSRRVIPSALIGSSCVDPCECAIIYGRSAPEPVPGALRVPLGRGLEVALALQQVLLDHVG